MRGARIKTLPSRPAPRFFLEIAAAGFLTLCAVGFAGRSTRAAAPAPVKISMQAAPQTISPAAEDQSVADFMERFALSRLAPTLPEKLIVAPDVAPPASAAAAARRETPPAREKARSVAFRQQPAPLPPARAVEKPPVQPVPEPPVEIARAAPPAKGIPVISFIAEKLPTGRDIVDGAASLGKRVTSLFTRG